MKFDFQYLANLAQAFVGLILVSQENLLAGIEYTPYVLPFLVSAIISLGLLMVAWQNRRTSKANYTFVFFMLGVLLWTLFKAYQIVVVGLQNKLIATNWIFIGVSLTTTFWLIYALYYTGKEKWVTKRNMSLLILPSIAAHILLWTNDSHSLFWKKYYIDYDFVFPQFQTEFGIGYWVFLAFVYILMIVSWWLLISAWIKQRRDLFRGQVALLVLSNTSPFLLNIAFVFGYYPIDLTPVGFVPLGIILLWGARRYRFLDIAPIARDIVVDRMRDMMIVLDRQNRVVDINPAALTVIGISMQEAIGQFGGKVFSRWPKLVAQFEEVSDIQTEIMVITDIERYYDLTIMSLDHHAGRLLVLRDITKKKQIEIEQVNLIQEAQTRAEELEILRSAGNVIVSSLNLEETINLILEQLAKVVPYDSASVQLLKNNHLEIVGGHGFEHFSKILGLRFPMFGDDYNGPGYEVYKTKQFIIFDDVRPIYEAFKKEQHAHIRGWMGIPLIWQNELIGIITIDSAIPGAFTKDHARVALAFADQVAIALENAQLFEEVQRQIKEISVLHRITAAGAEAANVDALIEKATKIVGETLHPNSFGLMLVDEEEGILYEHSSYNWEKIADEDILILPIGEGVTGRVALTGESLIVPDVSKEPGYYAGDPKTKSEMCVPIKIGMRVIGVMNFESAKLDDFSKEDEQLMLTIGNQLATAIDKVRLFEEVQKLATMDPLTQLHNRRHFLVLANLEFTRANRYDHALSALMIDLDHFKQVNDSYGHAVGDQALIDAVERCRAELRQTDMMGRYGGEEFVVLLPETDIQAAEEIAKRMQIKFSTYGIKTKNESIPLTISIGVAELTDDCATLEVLINRADEALYAAKNAGRDCVRVWGR